MLSETFEEGKRHERRAESYQKLQTTDAETPKRARKCQPRKVVARKSKPGTPNLTLVSPSLPPGLSSSESDEEINYPEDRPNTDDDEELMRRLDGE